MGHSTRPAELLSRAGKLALQHPLIESQASVAGLCAATVTRAPGTIFVGIGLCTRAALSPALPIDVLGLLLPAEELRRAMGAERLLILVADAHAVVSGFSERAVAARAHDVESILHRVVRALELPACEVLRASKLHRTALYEEVLAEVQERAPANVDPYFVRQAADVAVLDRLSGGLAKVGWTVGSNGLHRRDEVAFDRRFREWVGDHVPFLYCKAGRALDDKRRKAPPYVTLDAARRVCLARDEDVACKLARAGAAVEDNTLRGARRYWRALTSSIGRLAEPLSGTVEERLQSLIGRVFS